MNNRIKQSFFSIRFLNKKNKIKNKNDELKLNELTLFNEFIQRSIYFIFNFKTFIFLPV